MADGLRRRGEDARAPVRGEQGGVHGLSPVRPGAGGRVRGGGRGVASALLPVRAPGGREHRVCRGDVPGGEGAGSIRRAQAPALPPAHPHGTQRHAGPDHRRGGVVDPARGYTAHVTAEDTRVRRRGRPGTPGVGLLHRQLVEKSAGFRGCRCRRVKGGRVGGGCEPWLGRALGR